MKKSEMHHLNFNIYPEDHKKVKKFASIHGQSVNEYILESVRERLLRENEETHLEEMTTTITPVLQELWDNDKDASYDQV